MYVVYSLSIYNIVFFFSTRLYDINIFQWHLMYYEVYRKGMKVIQSCLTIPQDQSMEFSRPEYWNGKPFSSPGELPNPEMEPRSPALQTSIKILVEMMKIYDLVSNNNSDLGQRHEFL